MSQTATEQELWRREAWWLGLQSAVVPRAAAHLRGRAPRLLVLGRGAADMALALHRPGRIITVVESCESRWRLARAALDARGIAAIHGEPGRILAAAAPPPRGATANGATLAAPPREDLVLGVRCLEQTPRAEMPAMVSLMRAGGRAVVLVELEPDLAGRLRLAMARRSLAPESRATPPWDELLALLRPTCRIRNTHRSSLRIVEITPKEHR